MGHRRRSADEPARIGRIPAWWLVAAMVVLLMGGVYFIVQGRGGGVGCDQTKVSPPPSLVLPVSPEAEPESVSGTPASDVASNG